MAIALCACGPQLETLASQRHYREAVCAANDGSGDDRAYVHRKLIADLDPKLHVEVVSSHQVRNALDGLGDLDQITERVRFLRVRLESNVVPIDSVGAEIAITAKHQLAGAPIDWSVLAAITGEQLPPPETYSTYVHPGTFWKGLAAFFTAGISLKFTTFRKRTYAAEPSDAAYERTAPTAYRLRAAMLGGRGCDRAPSRTKGSGMTCTWFVALDPSTVDPLQLEIAFAYAANRQPDTHHTWRDPESCTVTQTTTVPLGRLRELGDRTMRTYGSRMRPLRELAVR